jgi:DNA polymerase III delta subunit
MLAEQGALPRLLLLLPPSRGEDEPWFAEQVLEAARTRARSMEGVDLLESDGGSPDFSADALGAFLSAASLFGGERVLVLGRAGPALSKNPWLAEALLAAAKSADGPSWMVVQIAGKNLKKTEPAGKTLDGAGRRKYVRVERFRRLYGDPPPWNPSPDGSEAAQFAAAEARARGMRLGTGAAGLLVGLAGSRAADLLQAVEHFAILGSEHVSEHDVREVAARSAEGNAFEFAEAVLGGNGPGALELLKRIRARGLHTWDGRRLGTRDAFSLLLAVLAGERRRTAAVREGMDRGLEISDALKQAGVAAGGPIAQRMQNRLDRCGPEQLQRVLQGVRRAERRVKAEGWGDAGHALEELALHAHRSRRAG